MKRRLKWALVALVVLVLAVAVLRALSARQAQQKAVAKAAQSTPTAISLSSHDVIQVKQADLAQALPISGALKAVSSAIVKARVAGELQGLSVREGDAVQAGQVIARIDSTEFQARVRQARQQAQAARAQVDIAQRSFDNNRSLVEQGFISKTALESSAATLAAAQANYQAAQAGAEIATKSLDDTVLRAPISGQISQRMAQPGERVGIDARIVEIIDLSRLELEASLGATDSMDVALGQTAILEIEGAADPVRAKVVRINPSAVAGSRAVQVYLAIEPRAGLRQGLFAQGMLGIAQVKTLAVPVNAVRTDKPQPYVQLVSGQEIHHQTVELGARGDVDDKAMVEIKGVPEDSMVLSGTVGVLREGSKINLPPSGK